MKTNHSLDQCVPVIIQSPGPQSGHRDIQPLNRPRDRRWLVPVTAIVTGILAFSGIGFAAKGGIPGPPSGGEVSNNLSVPSVLTGSVITIPHNWNPPVEPELGVHYSYACDKPESDGQFNYPNTSCVDSLTDPQEYFDAGACTDIEQPSPCEDMDVYRVYWQKVDANEWSADEEGTIGTTPDSTFRSVAFVDWGDALEAVSWNERSVIRVETQPYFNLVPGFNPTITYCADAALNAGLDPAIACKVGHQMWHVSGQGINEHWGVRADDVDAGNNSYNYDSPFQIIKTSNARLNLTKMAEGSALCSQPGGNSGEDPPDLGLWDAESAEWEHGCKYSDEPYSVELSVGGKYVYGFNWRMRYVDMNQVCPGYEKVGFWRLTFHAHDDVIFDIEEAPNVAPPAVLSELRQLPRNDVFNTIVTPEIVVPSDTVFLFDGEPVLEDEDPSADDRLYWPVVDTVNNLTYLDICIVSKDGGSGH